MYHRSTTEAARGFTRSVGGLALGTALTALVGCDPPPRDLDPALADAPLPTSGDPVDVDLARAGRRLFEKGCIACHRLDRRIVGPALAGVTERRDPAWLRGMVLSPDSMLRNDSVAGRLLREHRVPMIDTGLDEPGFRAVLEYLRAVDRGAPPGDANGAGTGDDGAGPGPAPGDSAGG